MMDCLLVCGVGLLSDFHAKKNVSSWAAARETNKDNRTSPVLLFTLATSSASLSKHFTFDEAPIRYEQALAPTLKLA